MRFEIRPLVRPIRLRDYAEEYGDETIWVWVNLPRQLRLAHLEIVRDFEAVVDDRKELEEQFAESGADELDEEVIDSYAEKLDDLGRRLHGWFAEVWSKHEDEETHWTAGEVGEMVDACLDADPRLWSWVQEEHWRLVNEHRDGVKKK
jgi:hypothetical protein